VDIFTELASLMFCGDRSCQFVSFNIYNYTIEIVYMQGAKSWRGVKT
jgi:hypothetical protein